MFAERLRPQAQQRRQRHAVHVAAGRGLRRVDVGMGIDPDQADLLSFAPVELRDARDRARRNGMVAAEDHGRHAFFERLQHHVRGA